MRVVLMGKGELAVKCLKWLYKNRYDVEYVVPETPEPTWTKSLLKSAEKLNIPVIKSGDYQDIPLDKISLAISIFYGKIIKKNFIDKCDEIINLHNGPLPKYRGVRPINWALKNNEHSHGITIHRIAEGIDDGPIFGQIKYNIYPEIEEVKDVYKKSLEYGYILFKDVLLKLPYLKPYPQQGKVLYYSIKEIPKLGERKGWTKDESVI